MTYVPSAMTMAEVAVPRTQLTSFFRKRFDVLAVLGYATEEVENLRGIEVVCSGW